MSAASPDPKVLESLPLEVLNTLPAGAPPPGIQPNFTDPHTQVPVILGVGTAFLVLALIFFSIRIYTKLVIVKSWKWDDVTCTLGFMCSIVYFGVTVNGCINAATGIHIWDVHLSRVLSKAGVHQSYVTTIIVTPALCLIKSSLFIQYYLLFRPLRWVRITVWVGATISTLFYIAVTIAALVLESPWPGETFIEDVLSWHYLKFANFSIPTGVVGMLVDWYLLILPIPAVLTLHTSTAKKIGILIIFMTGALAAIASTVSLYYRIQLQNNFTDPTWGVGYILLWSLIEMFAGVAISSMPTVNQFFNRQNFSLASFKSSLTSSIRHLRSSSSSSNNNNFSTRGEKLTDDKSGGSSSRRWPMSDIHTSERQHYEADKVRQDLESDGHEDGKGLRMKESQIRLTKDIEIRREDV